MALRTLGRKLAGVRLDTPSSRRGDWRKLIEEVRWELDTRGGKEVSIFISGGLDEAEVRALGDVVDGFGVGTSVSGAPSIDFNMKVVEVEGAGGTMVPKAKRGDISGAKSLYRNLGTHEDLLMPKRLEPPEGFVPLLSPLVRDGRVVRRFLPLDRLRERIGLSLKAGPQRVRLLSRASPGRAGRSRRAGTR